MRAALEEAETAFKENEIPIGAIIVVSGNIISRQHNRNRALIDPTAHAEILALREAALKLGVFRLVDAEIYITVEPCPMCAGAMLYSRIKKAVYGCFDPKAGCDVSVCNLLNNSGFNHKVETVSGILADKSAELLGKFFKEKRALKKKYE